MEKSDVLSTVDKKPQ